MSYSLYRELIALTEEYEHETNNGGSVSDFSLWLSRRTSGSGVPEPDWEGKSEGRTVESVISTAIVHLYRYARFYSKVSITGSEFTGIDDVIYLINLLHRGSMPKIQLIGLNLHEKSTGLQIISRLLKSGFIQEGSNEKDKRSKIVHITEKGKEALDGTMDRIRHATNLVVGDLTKDEKMQFIRILNKLEDFHKMNFEQLSRF
jgi:MarR family transcriptional regulator, lower aerobic nicotinate degradation pathway regulator